MGDGVNLCGLWSICGIVRGLTKKGKLANGLALMLVSMHHRFSTHRFAGPAILTGGVLFSGSIMVLVLKRYGYCTTIGWTADVCKDLGYLDP